MQKTLIITFILSMVACSICGADEYEIGFMAGNTSVDGGLHYKKQLANGFWKLGGTGLTAEDEGLEYKWIGLDFTVGTDILLAGLTCGVGVSGKYGNAKDNGLSGDVGMMAFTGQVGYVFSEAILPVPIELFAMVIYAPESITFADTKGYLAYHIGVGLRVVQYVSVFLKYRACDLDMISAEHPWTLEDEAVQLGLVFRF